MSSHVDGQKLLTELACGATLSPAYNLRLLNTLVPKCRFDGVRIVQWSE
jgi:hypothetical protein